LIIEALGTTYADLDIDELPNGLRSYFWDHWRRMGMRVSPIPRHKIRILYTLAEMLRPVSRELLSDFGHEDQLTVQEVLDEWGQFLRPQDIHGHTHYSLYHSSFRDFLRLSSVLQAAGVDLEEVNASIADVLWPEVMGDE